MVRLQCKCGHIWVESKQQRESEKVFCPKCSTFHHAHTPMKNPPKPIRYGDAKDPPYKPPLRMINPPKEKLLFKKDLEGRTIETTKTYETREKKKR